MDLISEIEKYIQSNSKSRTSSEYEQLAVEYIQSLDFKDQDIFQQSVDYVRDIVDNYISKNLEISSLQAKVVHCILVKFSLAQQGLDDVKIVYRDKNNNDLNAGASYNDFHKTITFFNDNVCNKDDFLKPYGTNIDRGADSRLDYLTRQIFVMQHEIQHAIQYKNIHTTDIQNLSSSSYVISLQEVARIFSQLENTKYYKKENIDKLYNDNHDQFYYEIEADKFGVERALNILKVISPRAYQLATDTKRNTYVKKLENKTYQLESYLTSIMWNHHTNPNNDGVLATHKASMIVDNVLPKLSPSDRQSIFNTFPLLAIVYNENGSKKSLEQIENEKREKIKDVVTNIDIEDVKDKIAEFSKIYDTAIDCDAVLSFEKTLRDIERVSVDDNENYRQELQILKTKAIAIVNSMEDVNATKLNQTLRKYKKEILAISKKDEKSRRIYQEKKLLIFAIESEIYRNAEVLRTIRKDEKEAKTKRKTKEREKKKATEILQKVFPNFIPHPNMYILSQNKFVSNVNEKLCLLEAYKDYVKTLIKQGVNIRKEKDFVTSREVYEAIKTLYDFQPTNEEIQNFNALYKEGEIGKISNKYSYQENFNHQQNLNQNNQFVEENYEQEEEQQQGIDLTF